MTSNGRRSNVETTWVMLFIFQLDDGSNGSPVILANSRPVSGSEEQHVAVEQDTIILSEAPQKKNEVDDKLYSSNDEELGKFL